LPQTKLNILQVLRAPIGGLFRHVLDLSLELEKRGHKVGMVIDNSMHYIQTDEWHKQMEQNFKLGIHTLNMSRKFGITDFTNPFTLNKLAHSLDVNVLHGQGAKGGFYSRLARPKNSIALYTPHGGVLNYDQNSVAGKIFNNIEKMLMHRTSAIVFESAFVKNKYIERIGSPKFPAPVVLNGLLENEFLPIKTISKPFDFSFIGELRSVKGIEFLIDALVNLVNSDGEPAKLVIAGDGPMRTELEAKISDLNLSKRVKFLGVRNAREVLAMGKCLVIPSLKESLPYVILEAAAAKVPLISTTVGGIAEIFGPTTSSLIKPANVDELKSAMQGFLDNEKAAKQEAKVRFDFVEKNFTIRKMVDEIEQLYLSTLKN